VRPGDDLLLMPQADGGEGTLDAIEASVNGSRRHEVFPVEGPDGRPTRGEWLTLPDGTAVVELAQMCGLPLMGTLDAKGASTRGLGQTIGAALDAGAASLVVTLGGSASTDGGAGALTALGVRLLDAAGEDLTPGGGALAHLARVDVANLTPAPVGGVTMLTDVTSPLLGPAGSAAVFGPQKGATPHDVHALDDALARFATLVGGDADAPGAGAGAAGGTAFGFAAVWGAHIEPGADHLQRLTGLWDLMPEVDLVITGEGQYDSQSLDGKVVGQVLRRASDVGTKAAVIAGRLAETPSAWAVGLADIAGSVDLALVEPERWLRAAGERAAAAMR
jgi:glycerate 2-kinase